MQLTNHVQKHLACMRVSRQYARLNSPPTSYQLTFTPLNTISLPVMTSKDQTTSMDVDETQIDEGLYSRQLYVAVYDIASSCSMLTDWLLRYVLGHEGCLL